MRLIAALPAIGMLLLAACGRAPASGSPTSRPTASGAPLSQVELKYGLFAQLGPIDYCDRDEYPVGREVTPAYVKQQLADIQVRDSQTYLAILGHHQLSAPLAQQQELPVYTDYKQLAALQLQPDGDRYDFSYAASQGSGKESTLTKGTIDRFGSVNVQSRVPFRRICPICLAASTQIDTPSGRVPVTSLRPGMAVWTMSVSGNREAGVVLEVGNMPVPTGHEVVHLVLADGREVSVSPGHPTADGRRVGDLVPGDELDGSRVVAAHRTPYSGATYDLLPSGPTSSYWANGVLLGSTLAGGS